ncbi:inactive rhomboid protein 1 isoform X5 [Scleropages formosus]|uniref:inactive rhomboid protein 1 isoform X5 n=1 Tax=Scleropages formosus TaxID=113540 RepID=UPI00087852D0|nr:inactive rhomboid protein 1 isoform X5 [Scleropages formosus]
MAEPRNQGGGSSLQRKKPPWLRLDIPAAQVSQDEPPTFVQSVRRQGFLRSISMPVESTVHFHSPASDPHDARDRRRQAFQRQTSITQTIKSSKKVHFERISTVPIKGSRAARRVSRRGRSLSKLFLRGTADWFGVSKDGDATQKWQRKSLRHCSLRYGKLKPQVVRDMELPSQDNISITSTETPPPLYVPAHPHGMQKIVDPLARGRAFRMVEDADGCSVPQTPITPGATSLCSFSSSRSGFNRLPRRRKRESVAKMSFRAAAALVKGRSLHETATRHIQRRSFTPGSFLDEEAAELPDELDTSFFAKDGLNREELSTCADEVFESPVETDVKADEGDQTGGALDKCELERSHLMLSPLERGWRKGKEGTSPQPKVRLQQEVVSVNGQRRGQRIATPVKKLFAREKRPYGLGMVGKLTNRTYRSHIDSYVKRQIEDMDDHRPFFTYWITFVHLLITILAVGIYGIAPIGFSQHETVDSVLRNKGVYENVKFVQQENFWVGPSSEALIHLGAKFSPCMRQDRQVHKLIQAKQDLERNSACCVRNDRSGCVQTSREQCSSTLAVWVKWPEHLSAPKLQGKVRQYGSVCHQDPRCDGFVLSRAQSHHTSGPTTSPGGRSAPNPQATTPTYPTLTVTSLGGPAASALKGGALHGRRMWAVTIPQPTGPGPVLPTLAVTLPACWDPPLPGLCGLPDDHPQRPGEASRLAAHLHHLHPEWHHRESCQCHLSTLPSRGGSGWLPVWNPGLPLRGALPELADSGAALAGTGQTVVCCPLPLCLWPAALD